MQRQVSISFVVKACAAYNGPVDPTGIRQDDYARWPATGRRNGPAAHRQIVQGRTQAVYDFGADILHQVPRHSDSP